MKRGYSYLMGLAMLLTLGFAGGSVLTATPVNAIIIAICPDGSIPDNNFNCPETCETIDCPFGSSCQIQNNAPACVPTLSCANVLCTANSRCVETPNGPQCIPVGPPTYPSCAELTCGAGTQCREIAGRGRCVPVYTTPTHPTCSQLACSGSTQCRYIAGQPRCVPVNSGYTGGGQHYQNYLAQRQQACIAAGNVWTGTYCRSW